MDYFFSKVNKLNILFLLLFLVFSGQELFLSQEVLALEETKSIELYQLADDLALETVFKGEVTIDETSVEKKESELLTEETVNYNVLEDEEVLGEISLVIRDIRLDGSSTGERYGNTENEKLVFFNIEAYQPMEVNIQIDKSDGQYRIDDESALLFNENDKNSEKEGLYPILYSGDYFKYEEHGLYKRLLEPPSSPGKQTFELQEGEAVESYWVTFGEDIVIENMDLIRETFDAAGSGYHGNLWWSTPEGSYRYVPESYVENDKYLGQLYVENLQASSPNLLVDFSKVTGENIFRAFIVNSAYTLMLKQGEDGFFRTGVEAEYLNRSYGIPGNFIDTRLSASASIFLVSAGKLYGSEELVESGLEYFNYFKQLRKKGDVHKVGDGILYPDYYHEEQYSDYIALSSLNHTVHNINYMFHLKNNGLLSENDNYFIKESLQALEDSRGKWVASSGDLYYGFHPNLGFYGNDYAYVTYRDLFVLKSNLERHGYSTEVVNYLFNKKHAYLQSNEEMNDAPGHLEDNLDKRAVVTRFTNDEEKPRYGRAFLSPEVRVTWAHEGEEHGFYSLGNYLWITGAAKIEYISEGRELNGEDTSSRELDPEKKYFILIKDGMIETQEKWGT